MRNPPLMANFRPWPLTATEQQLLNVNASTPPEFEHNWGLLNNMLMDFNKAQNQGGKAPKPPPPKPSLATFPAQITASGGMTYTVDLYNNGLSNPPISGVSVRQLQIASGISIPKRNLGNGESGWGWKLLYAGGGMALEPGDAVTGSCTAVGNFPAAEIGNPNALALSTPSRQTGHPFLSSDKTSIEEDFSGNMLTVCNPSFATQGNPLQLSLSSGGIGLPWYFAYSGLINLEKGTIFVDSEQGYGGVNVTAGSVTYTYNYSEPIGTPPVSYTGFVNFTITMNQTTGASEISGNATLSGTGGSASHSFDNMSITDVTTGGFVSSVGFQVDIPGIITMSVSLICRSKSSPW